MNDDFDALLFFDRQKIRSDLDRFFDSFSNCVVNIDAIPQSIQCSIPPELFSVIKSRFVQMNETDIEAFKNKARDFMTYQIEAGFPLVQSVIQNTLKFACFSEAIDSAAMWGYYGDSGKGFALAYDFRNYMYTDCASCDKSTVCPSSQKANLYRMIYDDTPFDATEFAEYLLQQQMLQTISLNLPLNNVPRHAVPCPDLFMSTKVLLHKSTSWRHEHEWRFVYNCSNNTTLSEKFVYAKKKTSAIYLGRKINPTYEKLLRHIAVEKNIPVYKMTINENESTYRLVPKMI